MKIISILLISLFIAIPLVGTPRSLENAVEHWTPYMQARYIMDPNRFVIDVYVQDDDGNDFC